MRHCAKCDKTFTAGESVCPHDGTILEDSVSFEESAVGQTLDGKYRIDGFLTRGGMGAVYRGTHVMLNKPVAIKLIKPELVGSRDIVERFLREARAAAHLSHPNIVTVHDLGQTNDGMLYIAMELVDGKSLKQLIVDDGACEPARAVHLLKGVTKALALAHREGVLHRDLKPQNIMVTLDAHGEEIPKLLDFGIAKTVEPDSPALTATGMVLGTPHYMSTEQAKGQPADQRSDLYALGVILYEMLVGRVPFDDASIPQILIKHLNEIPKLPPELSEKIPSGISAIALRLMEKDPNDRFQDAAALLGALERVTDTAIAGVVEAETVATMATAPIPQKDMETSAVQETTMAGGMAAAMPPPPLPMPSASAGAATGSSTGSPTIRARDAAIVTEANEKSKVWMLAVAVLLVAIAAFALWPRGSETPEAVASTGDTAAMAAMANPGSEGEPEPAAGIEVSGGGEATASGGGGSPPPTTGSGAPSAPATGSRPEAETSSPPPPPVTRSAGGAPVRHAEAGAAPAGASPAARNPAPRPEPEAAAPPPQAIPAVPTVTIVCDGVRDGCAALRRAVVDECRRRSVPVARGPAADVVLRLDVEEIEARSEQQFGTTFVIRTYAIEASGDSRHFDDEIYFNPESITFDARLGREKLVEQARLIARNLVNEIDTYWSGHTR